MLAQTARKALVVTLVAGAVVVLALALWKLRLVISLVFLGFIIAAAMRPSIEVLQRWRIPRGVGIAIHYLLLAGLVALFLWLVVPRAVTQVQNALGGDQLKHAARNSTGIKHEILAGLQRRLERLPSGSKLIKPAAEVTKPRPSDEASSNFSAAPARSRATTFPSPSISTISFTGSPKPRPPGSLSAASV